MFENDPCTPVMRAKLAGELRLYEELGLAKFGCLIGKLKPSKRSWKRARSSRYRG